MEAGTKRISLLSTVMSDEADTSGASARLRALWGAGVTSVRGDLTVSQALFDGSAPPDRIIAVGKAAASMARAALDLYGLSIPTLVLTKYGHATSEIASVDDHENLTVLEAGHPIPDENSIIGGKALIDQVEACREDDHLLFLVSGGASAISEYPLEGSSLSAVKELTERLLGSGDEIHEMNRARRSISAIKGGRLLERFGGKCVRVLAVSDVRGDEITVIGSGIGAPPESGQHQFDYSYEIIASNALARSATADAAVEAGLVVHENAELLYGDVATVAKQLGERIRAQPVGVCVYGGEPTVQLGKKVGTGGRNQALALALAREIDGRPDLHVIVGATDGTDGPTQAAGGIIDGASWGSTPAGDEAMRDFDSGSWLERAGCRFDCGVTGTNVMDLVLTLRTK